MTKDEMMTIKQAARFLSIPEPVLRLTIRCGKIPARHGRGRTNLLVRRSDIQHFVDPLIERRAG